MSAKGDDSDPLPGNKVGDFTSMICDAVSSVQYKLFFSIFAMFIFLSSDVFIQRILSSFNGAVDYKNVTSWGTVLQGMFLIIASVCADMLIRQKIL